MLTTHPLHEKAVLVARRYLVSEAELLEVIQDIDREKVWRKMEYSSLHIYIVSALKVSEFLAYNLVRVARASLEVPKLKAAIINQELNVNTARKLLPVLTPENQEVWIEKAKKLKQKQLEKEVAAASPKPEPVERIRPVAKSRSELKCGISDELETKLRRVQDLESQRTGKSCSLEEALQAMAELYLTRKDPVKKAERVTARSERAQTPTPVPSRGRKKPARVFHEVRLRDRGQCQFRIPSGGRCGATRFLDIHHIKPVSHGGLTVVDNLVTLCSSHHTVIHLAEEKGIQR